MNSAINHIVFHCGNLKKNEKTLVLFDRSTKKLSYLFYKSIKTSTKKIKMINVGNLKFHGEEVNNDIRKEMCKSKLIFCLTKYSLAHSTARIQASKKGARFLSLPNYSLKFLSDVLDIQKTNEASDLRISAYMKTYKKDEENIKLH